MGGEGVVFGEGVDFGLVVLLVCVGFGSSFLICFFSGGLVLDFDDPLCGIN